VIVVDREAQRFDQPHLGTDGDAGSADISGIGWNLGLV